MAMDPERAKSALLKSLLILPERRNPADLERIEEALRSAEPLSRYPSSKLSKLSRICQRFELAQNDSVFLEGDESVYFYLLIEGTVVFSKADENGQRMVIREVSSFGWFGEDVLFEVSPCIDQIRAAISAQTLRFRFFVPAISAARRLVDAGVLPEARYQCHLLFQSADDPSASPCGACLLVRVDLRRDNKAASGSRGEDVTCLSRFQSRNAGLGRFEGFRRCRHLH